MNLSISSDQREQIMNDLRNANLAFKQSYPGESHDRQPVHTVYGGANLFKSDTTQKIGNLGVRSFETYAPNFSVLAKALKIRGHQHLPTDETAVAELSAKLASMSPADRAKENSWLAYTVYQKVAEKLQREAVEDFRIDFEDGFGNRPDEEEDQTAIFTAEQLAQGVQNGTVAPYMGIRIKPFTEELKDRAVRTLDLFVTRLSELTDGTLPANFVVTLPKVEIPEQVTALVQLFESLEQSTALQPGSLKMEIMIETTQSILNSEGAATIRSLVQAAQGRCRGAHFGTYDYTASTNIIAAHQVMDHPIADYAHHVMKVALAGTGIFLSDGATNVMPVGPHRGNELTEEQRKENAKTVHAAWITAFDHTRHSLYHGRYQGWDLHPAQLPIRYAAVFSFFLESYHASAARLRNFIERAAQATLTGDVFDDAATGQGLLNYFLLALNAGAVTEQEVLATGLTLDELRGRSFYKILEGRKQLG